MGLFGSSKKSSHPPPPPPPPPPQAGPSGARPQAHQAPVQQIQHAPAGSIGIGIETEFMLKARRHDAASNQSLHLFARKMCNDYNGSVPGKHPRMFSLVQNLFEGPPHLHWCLVNDPTCETTKEPWGIELVSPILRIYPGSAWREHVEAAWNFLETLYTVHVDKNCSTHIHLSLADGYTISQLKRLAQAVIHFEPAIEALVPPDRRGNEYARSNWIDNSNFGYRNLSREQSIEQLEKCMAIDEVIRLMNPNDSRYFGWNFLAMKKYKTVEFRRGAGSRNVNDVFMWVEFALSFLQASLKLGSAASLKQYPASVGGLSMFISFAGLQNQPGMNSSVHLNRLFAGRNPNEHVPPKPVGNLTPERRKKLEKKLKVDASTNPMLTKIHYAQSAGLI
ncbi:putative amidoligase enzyme-domain-containing protein [Hypoxylon sp. FL1857]|nr:putative amidoligase enzyme-domain-containing protein [Hypoxylon sp. FL1857]